MAGRQGRWHVVCSADFLRMGRAQRSISHKARKLGENMGGNLDELAKVAGDALVSAMVSGSWDSARHRFAAVVGHEQRMEMGQAELAAAKGEDREREQQAQAQRWTTRLRDVLDDDHSLAVDLRGLLTEP